MSIEKEIKQGSFRSEQMKAMINFLYTANGVQLQQTQFFKKFDLSAQQYNILRILKGQLPNAATVNLLIERMLDKSSNASRLVEKLRLKGLVDRVQNKEDRRAVNIKITNKGLALIDEIAEAHDEIQLLNVLSDKEAKSLNEILDKIRTAYKQ
ncbi:MarR family transcriptional regulator [Flavobacteriales bacterium]|nr:MarR family transcriptional regulator [Flavobacteriales bacterium]